MLRAIVFFVGIVLAGPAFAQTSPNLSYGQVPTAGQWNSYFAGKQDYLGAAPCIVSGCTMGGPLLTAAATTAAAGFNIPPGTAPTSPNNGDLWATSSGLFVQVAGITIGPLIGTGQLPLGTNISLGIVQCDGSTITCSSGGVITAVGAVATSIGVGSTNITSGTTNGVLYDNGGVLGNLATANNAVLGTNGSGVPSMSTTLPSGLAATNIVLTTPTLGVASGISLALGGASIGGNALAVTGTVLLNTPLNLASGGTAASLTASNGGIVYSTSSAFAVLSGTVTAGECLLSGSSSAPSWGACTGSAAVASVGNPVSDTTLTIAGTGSGPYTGTVTLAINLANSNTWTGAATFSDGLTVSSSFTATGLVTAADLATKTGSGSSVVLATSPTIASPTITGTFTATGLVTTADLATVTGSGSVVLSSSAALSSPTITNLTVSSSIAGIVTGSGDIVLQTSPTITTPTISQINGAVGAYLNLQGNPVLNAASGDTIYFEQAATPLYAMTATGFITIGGSGYLGTSASPWGNLYVALPTTSAALHLVCWNPSTDGFSHDSSSCLTSSLRYKHDVEPLINNLAAIAKIDPISFVYDDQSAIAGRQDGVSAESLAKADPLLVSYDDQGRPERPKEFGIIGRLVGAVKELKADNDNLRAEVESLRSRHSFRARR